MTDAICDRCGLLYSQHRGPEHICPRVLTFRPRAVAEVSQEAANIAESVRVHLGMRAADFDAWLWRTMERLRQLDNEGEEWKR